VQPPGTRRFRITPENQHPAGKPRTAETEPETLEGGAAGAPSLSTFPRPRPRALSARGPLTGHAEQVGGTDDTFTASQSLVLTVRLAAVPAVPA
jgi:hypothetical protein